MPYIKYNFSTFINIILVYIYNKHFKLTNCKMLIKIKFSEICLN